MEKASKEIINYLISADRLTIDDVANYLAQMPPTMYDNHREIPEELRESTNWGFTYRSLFFVVRQYKEWHQATEDDVLEEFKYWFSNESKTPQEISDNYIENIRSHWGRIIRPLEARPDTPHLENGEDYFNFQCGTSLHRGILIPKGLGYVKGERTIWISGKDYPLGLQISERGGNHHRSSFSRLVFYASNQASMGCSKPAIVIGRIQRKYVFDENNSGEYFIPNVYFSKIEDFEILSLKDYEDRFNPEY